MKAGIYRNADKLIYVAKNREVIDSLYCNSGIPADLSLPLGKASESKGTANFANETYALYCDPIPGMSVADQLVSASMLVQRESNATPEAMMDLSADEIAQLDRRAKRAAKANDGIPMRLCTGTPEDPGCQIAYERSEIVCPYCGKQSARKHRKAGHRVSKVGDGRYFWELSQ